ncbi:uncharacterized protein KY384_001081 [Bacidia gigantensis]|uniref:uncharacterized protein n=1 Tax=Bacidia gigantensis TaxID=2732470 RepID=UPI001D051C08|nr:uncharacterized protein KY384_001081 [Bacidia gigantensis]KAG8534237.1 hypothetical protein KY384_001081 [Bacidia gigantensis]
MASEEDNFDIDIYGDGGEEYPQDTILDEKQDAKTSDLDAIAEAALGGTESHKSHDDKANQSDEPPTTAVIASQPPNGEVAQRIASTDQSSTDLVQLPRQAPQMQGVKRKEGEEDDRPVGQGATTALFVSDLHWWITDDDVRGWANQSQCEDELEDITFNEHKVNGKSKGQVYATFRTTQAATAVKQKIESFGEGQQYSKKFAVSYSNPYNNPFRTLPKDGPLRNAASANNPRSNSGAVSTYASNGYRGGRGGSYNNRGGGGGSNYSRAGFPTQFQNSAMGNFPQMGSMPSYGGFQGRGGMMNGIRGGVGMRGEREV